MKTEKTKQYFEVLANLAHKCIQFKDGEMTGYDMTMFENLLPILSEPFFDSLRTNKQLGYDVNCGMRSTLGLLGFNFSVVSGSHPKEVLEIETLRFVASIPTILSAIDSEKFNCFKSSLQSEYLTKDTSLNDKSKTVWDELELYRGKQFNIKRQQATCLDSIEMKDLFDLCTSSVNLVSSQVRCIIVTCEFSDKEVKEDFGNLLRESSYFNL